MRCGLMCLQLLPALMLEACWVTNIPDSPTSKGQQRHGATIVLHAALVLLGPSSMQPLSSTTTGF